MGFLMIAFIIEESGIFYPTSSSSNHTPGAASFNPFCLQAF